MYYYTRILKFVQEIGNHVYKLIHISYALGKHNSIELSLIDFNRFKICVLHQRNCVTRETKDE